MKKVTIFSSIILLSIDLLLGFYQKALSQKINLSPEYYLLIGTYAPADSNGIYVYRFNTENGSASYISAISGIENPSYLTISPNHHFVYVVSETYGHPDGGSVYSCVFNSSSGELQVLNHEPSGGLVPCYISMDKAGHWVFVANYGSGSLSVFPINGKGMLGKAVQAIQHHGNSINKQRQSQAHVHCIIPTPDNKEVLVSDLGMDKVMTYKLNTVNGSLSPGDPPFIKVTPGTGPRHLTFHPNGKYVYLTQEMGGVVSVFSFKGGKLTFIQAVSTLPTNYHGRIGVADVHLSPDGKFLYISNRDDLNDIVFFSVNAKSGKLTYAGRQPSGGLTPRGFVITPDGKYLLAGHQNGTNISVFKRDIKKGTLTPTKKDIHVPHVACLKMIPVDELQ